MQVLYGDVESAAHTLHQFLTLVHRWGVPPELFNLATGQLVRPSYPLRPELAESLYYISQATSDPVWLRFGRDMVKALQTITRAVRCCYVAVNALNERTTQQCGFASVKNVETRELDDHMDSYFLSETLKYV